MKAVVVREFGPASVLHLEDVPKPVPAPDEVLIEVHAVSVNRSLDCAARAGTYSRPIPLPFTPGVDPSGVIVDIGRSVTGLQVGDRVAAKLNVGGEPTAGRPVRIGGGYAEYALAEARHTSVIPDSLGFPAATVISRHTPLALTLLRDRGRVQPGDRVLVMGASGGLGSAGVQVAKHLGAFVIAAAGADERVAVGLDLGADAGVNYRTQDLRATVLELTGGRGVDVVFENIGEPELFTAALGSLCRDGRLITVGSHGGSTVPLDLTAIYQRGLTISGTTKVDRADVALSLSVAAAGGFRALIDRVMPLSQAAAAHQRVESRTGLGKIVLDTRCSS